MGVCCIVFDIDGMLFEFFMNSLNIEKNKILRIFFSKISCFVHVLFPTLKKKYCVKTIRGGGGGGVLNFFFFRKTISFSFHVLCYFQHLKKKN